jgi:hypothetical protein
MALLGNTLQTAYSSTVKDTFNGDGSTVAFTLSRPSRTNDVEVFVENVQQEPTVAYSVSGTTLTFTAAPESGTGNIYVVHRTQATQSLTVNTDDIVDGAITAGKIAEGAVTDPTPAAVSGQANTATDFFALPSGTTAQRPGSPAAGYVRHNTDENIVETYDGSNWVAVGDQTLPYAVELLIVAGGGGADGGGGGAGGLVYVSSLSVAANTEYQAVVGAGGSNPSATPGGNNTATNGIDSEFSTYTAVGGGRGTYFALTAADGGSGGGGGGESTGGSGTSGQGNAGGSGVTNSGGGGGGFSSAGSNAPNANQGGNGGDGTNAYSSWATATSTGDSGYYAGGGGGGCYQSGLTTSGGAGGGGDGAYSGSDNGQANTGGGGGGIYASYPSGNGGSGIVIIRYSGGQRGTGGTVTSSGGYTYHTFTESGTYTA